VSDPSDPRLLTAALATVVFVMATVCTLLYRAVEKHDIDERAHSLSGRLLLWSLWTLALLGIYSGSSFIWAGDTDPTLLEAARYIRLALTTGVGIMLGGLLLYWVRIIRRS
jgi:Na+-driven multidrug efflux pump